MSREALRGWSIAFLVLVLIVAVPNRLVPAVREAWLRHSGAVDPNTGSGASFGPVRNISVGGPRWGTPDTVREPEQLAAYHAIVLLPSSSATEVQQFYGGVDPLHDTRLMRWRVDVGGRAVERTFRADYDVLWQRVTLGGVEYRLSKGNVFVVHLDRGAEPVVTQLPATVAALDDRDAVNDAARNALPDDAALQAGLRQVPRLRRPAAEVIARP